MKIYYDEKKDMLYIRFDEEHKQIINKRVTEDIVMDIEDNGKIIGIEIMDASKNVSLKNILPINYEVQLKKSIAAA